MSTQTEQPDNIGEARTAIISGGTSGIGRAIALALGHDGYRIVVLDVSEVENLRAAFDREHIVGEVIHGDVANAADCQRAVSAAAELGHVSVLCNVAGIRPVGTILDTTEEIWDRVMAINLKGMFLLSRAVIPHMRRRGGGVIINVGSTSGYVGKHHLAYCTSKGAVIPFSKSLAVDHAVDRIRVNAVVPGFTQTGMTAGFSADIAQAIAERNVAGRIGLPEDMAAAVSFLVSDAASTISGTVIEVGVLPGTLPTAG
ncbi:MAG: SDR family NAD(P)-dependent oxidoreductase [Aquisalimonadaceae bacterium]